MALSPPPSLRVPLVDRIFSSLFVYENVWQSLVFHYNNTSIPDNLCALNIFHYGCFSWLHQEPETFSLNPLWSLPMTVGEPDSVDCWVLRKVTILEHNALPFEKRIFMDEYHSSVEDGVEEFSMAYQADVASEMT